MRGAAARKTDPGSSVAAAARMEGSGKAGAQRAVLLEAVRRRPGLTSKEYAVVAGIERHAAARRLPELLADGKVTRVEGPGGYRWFVGVKGKTSSGRGAAAQSGPAMATANAAGGLEGKAAQRLEQARVFCGERWAGVIEGVAAAMEAQYPIGSVRTWWPSYVQAVFEEGFRAARAAGVCRVLAQVAGFDAVRAWMAAGGLRDRVEALHHGDTECTEEEGEGEGRKVVSRRGAERNE